MFFKRSKYIFFITVLLVSSLLLMLGHQLTIPLALGLVTTIIVLCFFSAFLLSFKQSHHIKTQVPLKQSSLANACIGRLSRTIPFRFEEKVELIFLKKYPILSYAHFRWLMIEWKRYFLIASIMRETPMFSAMIDRLWDVMHREVEYNEISQRFATRIIPYTPPSEKNCHYERACFDWIYNILFDIHPTSSECWHGFFHYSQDKVIVDLYRKNELVQWFDTIFYPENELPDHLKRLQQYVKQTMTLQLQFIESLQTLDVRHKHEWLIHHLFYSFKEDAYDCAMTELLATKPWISNHRNTDSPIFPPFIDHNPLQCDHDRTHCKNKHH